METLGRPLEWAAERNSVVVLQRLNGHLAHGLCDVGRINNPRGAAEPQHQLREPRRVPDAQPDVQLTLRLMIGPLDRVAPRAPSGPGPEPQGADQVLAGRLEDAVR